MEGAELCMYSCNYSSNNKAFNLKQIHEKPDNGASMSRIAVKLHISQTTICTASHSCLESSCNFSTLKASEYLMQSRKTFFFF